MTRVNVVPVEELSDQWLIAEYRELPRCLKKEMDVCNIPNKYILGTGHMKWAHKFGLYTNSRMKELVNEMKFRGFCTTYSSNLNKYIRPHMKNYTPTQEDIQLNRERLKERYNQNHKIYKWTKRIKPDYL